MTFKDWVMDARPDDKLVRDFIYDAQSDDTLPDDFESVEALERYLMSQGACRECLEVVPLVWECYRGAKA